VLVYRLQATGNLQSLRNLYNDSVTVVDLRKRERVAEIELRPGKVDASKAGVAGGEYPFWVVAKGARLFTFRVCVIAKFWS